LPRSSCKSNRIVVFKPERVTACPPRICGAYFHCLTDLTVGDCSCLSVQSVAEILNGWPWGLISADIKDCLLSWNLNNRQRHLGNFDRGNRRRRGRDLDLFERVERNVPDMFGELFYLGIDLETRRFGLVLRCKFSCVIT